MDLSNVQPVQSFTELRYKYKAKYFKVPYLKPLKISTPSYFRRNCPKNEVTSTTGLEDDIVQSKKRGIILEWPHRGRIYTEKELCSLARLIAHSLFWLHVTHILPNGTALDLKQPPWNYVAPLPKPENRDYIIEPDWDSF